VLDAMRKAQIAMQFVYAFKKTGLMGFGDLSAWPADRREEWLAAVEEYTALSAASAGQSATRSGDLWAMPTTGARSANHHSFVLQMQRPPVMAAFLVLT
jgi:hypothetical protein